MTKYKFVPARLLHREVPLYFTEGSVHWYNVMDDCVEFRHAENPWNSTPENWWLIRDLGHDWWRLVKDGLPLISVKSETAGVIGGIFSPLEGYD